MAGAALATVILGLAAGAGASPEDPLESPAVPSHPVVGEMADGGGFLAVAFLACVVAPLVEETFFRGALYRHLREATGLRGRLPSAVVSALASGFLFAAVHPQGPLAIPLLMAVSFPLCLAREWRGSLLAPMAAHAFHNGLVTAFAWTALAP
jgi:membrane protease YdiL (CAAX protease family)